MKAAVVRRYGPPEVVQIEEVDKPVPADNEILVRVHATTVCAADWRIRTADPWFVRLMMGLSRPRTPKILGMELSGTVEQVGASVTDFALGDQVFGVTMAGAHAQYACLVAERDAAMKPANASHETAASIPFGGLTALRYFRKAGIKAGQKVLVYGASGSVGTHAVQLAKHFGADVTGVCSAANLALVRSLGADTVIDYATADFADAGPIYDIVMDTVGKSGFPRSLRALKPGGVYLLVAGPLMPRPQAIWAGITGRARVALLPGKRAPGELDFLRALVETGELTPVIDRRYALAEIAEAHRYAQTLRKKGQAVVVVD